MQRDHARLHRSLAVLGPPRRFQLMLLLLSGVDRSVSQLARAVRLSQSCTTRHLQSLERAGLVKGVRDGKRVVFRPAPRDATARGVLASLLRNAQDLGSEAAGLPASAISVASTAEWERSEDEASAPASARSRTARSARRAWRGKPTIAVDAPQPAGAFVVAGKSRATATSPSAATPAVMLAAGRSRRDAARRQTARPTARAEQVATERDTRSKQVRAVRTAAAPEPAKPGPDAPPTARAPSPAPSPAAASEPESMERRPRAFDTAFEPEFEQAFQPPSRRDEPESGNTSAPHGPPPRRSSDIEDFLL
jgi:DNA-binding transcriptional ArsR family regulator